MPVRSGTPVLCPYCTQPATLLDGSRVGARAAKVWACQLCRAWVPVYPKSPTNKPMGTLAKSELRALRARAYCTFDRMWLAAARLNGWSKHHARGLAYAWLFKQLGMRLEDTRRHIGFFDEQQTRRVIALVEGLTAAGKKAA